ncbi:Pyrimidine 5'-nucleotidase YjjG [compost metagenome]
MISAITPTPEAVFFDVDDTLYDHLIPFRKALQNILHTDQNFPYEQAYHRMRYYSDTLSAQAGGTPTHGKVLEDMRRNRFVLSLAEFGLHLTADQGQSVQNEYLNNQFAIELFDGAEALIHELKRRGTVVGLITNGPPEHQLQKIQALGVDRIVTSDRIFISGVVGITKPDRKLFDHVTASLGLTPSGCYYIGDSWRNDVVGAISAGWNVLWFNHRDVEAESHHQPHHVVSSYRDIASILLNLYN